MDVLLAPWVGPLATKALPKIMASLADKTSKIDLATAENWTIRDELAALYRDALAESLSAKSLSYPEGLGGPPRLLDALAKLFNEHFDPRSPVLPNHCVVTTGASLCLDALLFSLCERGDSVLVAAPYFNGFDLHLTMRSGCRIIPVHVDQTGPGDSGASNCLDGSLVQSLDQICHDCPEPSKLKALVVTNPHNPFGTCYSEHVLREAMLWCWQRNVHYISDEVYALSSFGDGDGDDDDGIDGHIRPKKTRTRFTSALAVDLGTDTAMCKTGDNDVARVHSPTVSVIWSTSKDLGSSGMRLGVYVKRPPPLLPSRESVNGCSTERSDAISETISSRCVLTAALALLTTPHLPSITCDLTTALLTSPQLPVLLSLSRSRLRHNYLILVKALGTWGVDYMPATSAPFLLARLGTLYCRWLEGHVEDHSLQTPVASQETCTWGEEDKMVALLRERAGVLVAPGRSFHMTQQGGALKEDIANPWAGWVRVTFGVPEAVLREALGRIAHVLGLQEDANYTHLKSSQGSKRQGTDGSHSRPKKRLRITGQ